MDNLTTGQSVGTIGGALIGGYFGGFPGLMLGMSIGGQVGRWIDPPDAPPPPKLGDLGLNTYVRNAPVTLAYGQLKVYGGCIWLGDIDVGMIDTGSKKAPEYQTTMDIDFAVSHCEGTIESYLQYYVDDKLVDEFIDDNEGWKISFTSYLGTAVQTVNSTIASFQSGGVTAIPFHYTAYSVIALHVQATMISTLPSIAAEVRSLLTEAGEEDANTIRVVYDFLTNKRYGAGLSTALFNGDPDTPGSPWETASDICDEIVSYTDENGGTVNEPRFRYSNYFDARIKGYDIVTDILLTCRGILRWKQGLLEPIIETDDMTPEFYFSDRQSYDITTGSSHTVSRIYANFSTYPDDYFNDATVFLPDGTEAAVLDQTSTYIDLCENLDEAPDDLIEITIIKDNIKEGSFNTSRTGWNEKSRRVRVEFINREVKDSSGNTINGYQWDVVEYENPIIYVEQVSGQPQGDINEKTVRLSGIKRKSQAMRMAQFFGDTIEYCQWQCDFVTDIVGYMRSVGDIIGITHTIGNWVMKPFRIIDMEELENDEVRIHCLEYNASCYSDDIPQVFPTNSDQMKSAYSMPDQTERFSAIQDLTENIIWLSFKRPDDEPFYWGVQVWVKKGAGDYEYVAHKTSVNPSVKLDTGGIDDSQVIIPYDSTTLYGSFPTSGSFWIEDELITYTGVSGDTFTGCTRGSNATAHTADKYCNLKQSTTPYIEFEDSDIGSTWEIRVTSVTVQGVTSTFSGSPTDSLVLT